MITPLASLAAIVLSATTPNRTVELSDPRLLVSASGIWSVTADGDTAYIVTDKTVKKVVYDTDLRLVDSLPSRSGASWGMSKYVHLGDGLGVMAIGGNLSDTAFWLIDWKGTSRTALDPIEVGSRWAGVRGLGFSKIATNGSMYGFSGESNLVGVRTGKSSAIFAGDKGIFQIGVGRSEAGIANFSVVSTKADSGKFLWSNVSLATNVAAGSSTIAFDFAGYSCAKKIKLLHSPYAVDDLGWLKHVDSSLNRSEENASAWQWGFNVASGTGKCWLHVSRSARLALHNCLVDGALEQDTLQIPALAKDTIAYQHQVFTTRSPSGLTLLAGDSILAFYDWDGNRLPVPAGTITLNKSTVDADFGDATFWHASGSELRAFRMKMIESANKPAYSKGIYDAGQLSTYWIAPESQKAFFVQVDGDGIDTTVYTTSNDATIKISATTIAARAAATSQKILWRVAYAAGLDANAPSSKVNALQYTAWQEASIGTAGVSARTAVKPSLGAIATENGLRISWTGDILGSLEILDASGRRLGLVDASMGKQIDFATTAKGLLLVRGANQIAKFTRF